MGIIRNILESFNNKPEGYSARKLSAFTGVAVGVYITLKCSGAGWNYVLVTWLVFALLCLGIITAEQVLKFKNGSGEEKK